MRKKVDTFFKRDSIKRSIIFIMFFLVYGFIVFLGFGLLGFSIYLFVALKNLQQKQEKLIADLEDNNFIQRKGEDSSSKSFSEVQRNELTQAPPKDIPEKKAEEGATVSPKTEIPTQETPPQKPFEWEDFLTGKFFPVLGALSVIMGIGFFISYAFSHSWIGPVGRIAIGGVVSFLFLVMGDLLRKKYQNFAPTVTSVGIAGFMVTTYFAENFYQFLSPLQSFLIYGMIILCGVLLSLRARSRILAHFSLVGGLIAPFLLGDHSLHLGILFYLLLLSAGSSVLSFFKKWYEIPAVLTLGVLMFEIPFIGSEKVSVIPLLVLIFAIHIVLSLGGIFRSIREKKEENVFEMVFMAVSLFLANILAGIVFSLQSGALVKAGGSIEGTLWGHFGFLVLFQAFLFFGLSQYLKRIARYGYQKVLLIVTLSFIVFATIWEIGLENPNILLGALIAEGILFSVMNHRLRENLYALFAKITMGLSFLMLLYLWGSGLWGGYSFIEGTFLTLLFLLGLGIVFFRASLVLQIIAMAGGIFTFLLWDFGFLVQFLEPSTIFLVILPASVLSAGLVYGTARLRSDFLRISGVSLLGFTHLWSWTQIVQYQKDPHFFPILALWILLLVTSFFVLAGFFKQEENPPSFFFKKLMVLLTLSFSSMGMFLWGIYHFSGHEVSIVWTIWGAILVLLGITKSWKHFRYFGWGTFCFLIAKLYLVDIWTWATVSKIIALSMLGVVLLMVSFWYYRKKIKESLNHLKK